MPATDRKYPQKVAPAQQTGKDYGKWYNTDNLKQKDGYAHFNVTSKTGSYKQPTILKTRAYGFNIPDYADITGVIVEDNHYNVSFSSSSAYPNITNVKFSVVYNNTTLVSYTNKKLYTSPQYNSYDLKLTSLTPKQLKSETFGLNIEFGANTNNNNGAFRLLYAPLKIKYVIPSYVIKSTVISDVDDIKVDSTVDIELNLTNSAGTSHNPVVNVNLPNDVGYVGKVSGDGTVSQSNNILTWNTGIKKGDKSKKIVIRLKTTLEGTKSIKTIVEPNNKEIKGENTLTFYVKSAELFKVTTDFESFEDEAYLKVDTNYLFSLKFDTLKPFDSKDYYIGVEFGVRPFDDYVSFFDGSDNVIYDDDDDEFIFIYPHMEIETTGYITINLHSPKEISLNLKATLHSPNDKEQVLGNFKLKFIDITKLRGVYYLLNENQTKRMGDSVEYELSTYIFTTSTTFTDLHYNCRLGVVNGLIDDSGTKEEILKNLLESNDLILFQTDDESEKVIDKEFKEQNVQFTYNEEYPVYIVVFSDVETSQTGSVHFTSPTLMELSEKVNNNPKCDFPNSAVSSANYKLGANEETNALRLYDFEFYDNEVIIQGILMNYLLFFNSFEKDIALFGDLTDNEDWLNMASRSAVITEEERDTEEIGLILGGLTDKWGLNSNSRHSSNIKNFIFDFYFKNMGKDDINVDILSFEILVDCVNAKEDKIKVLINDEDLSYYGASVTDIKLPFGLKTNNKYIDNVISDEHNSYLMSVDKNELEIDFILNGCNLEENTILLNDIARLFNNERDSMNCPILNTLKLSFLPDKVFHFVTEDNINANLEINDYECSIKLILVKGTYENEKPKLSGYVGSNDGIINVKPLITLYNIKEPFIEIVEEVTNQTFTIDFTKEKIDEDDLKIGKIWIDCEERTVNFEHSVESSVIENLTIDLTPYVDLTSDWFSINTNYEFNILNNNAEIYTVSFFEKGG